MGLFTSPMKLLSAIVIDSKAEAVAGVLLKAGLIDFVRISSLMDTETLKLKTGAASHPEIPELMRKLETLYKLAGIQPPIHETLSMDQMHHLDAASCRKTLDGVTSSLQQLREEQKTLHQEQLKLKEIHGYLKKMPAHTGSPGGKTPYITVHRGHPERGSAERLLKSLSSIPFFSSEIPESSDIFILSLKRDSHFIDEVFSKYEWVETADTSFNAAAHLKITENLEKKSSKIQNSMDSVQKQMSTAVEERREELDAIWRNLRLHELYMKITGSFMHTEKTSLFSGWLPAGKAEEVDRLIRQSSENQCIIEWSDARQHERKSIPVQMKHVPALDPFKMLVQNYAVPEYGSVDPTLFVAVAYLTMFGLMFADAGQGLVIFLIGLLGRRLMRGISSGVRTLLQLFMYCGAASIVTGVLFGSYFGYPWFAPLWFDYHGIVTGHAHSPGSISTVYDILKITIFFGIAVISCGLLINWINLIRKKDFFTLVLDKSGLIGGWFYGCGVYTAFYFAGSGYKQMPEGNLLFVFFGIPTILMLFKAPLHYFLHERTERKMDFFLFIDFFMEWVVELLEVFSGYLANTLSFMRVAGLGIAHVSLMSAFDIIARMTSSRPAAIVILAAGNILVIALEGLSAGIQALRLNYYEFFSRYFTGKGIAYNPISLRQEK